MHGIDIFLLCFGVLYPTDQFFNIELLFKPFLLVVPGICAGGCLRRIVYQLPSEAARVRNVKNYEPLDKLRCVQRELPSNSTAPVMAYHDSAIPTEMLDDRSDVADKQPHGVIVRAFWLVAQIVSAQ